MRLCCLVPVLLTLACGGSAPQASSAPPPAPVKVEVLAPAPLERTIEGTGSVLAIDSAALRPEVAGLVEAVLFEDGASVQKGAALVRLRSAEARAALQDAEARQTLATLERDRKRGLVERGDAAQAELDRAEAELSLAEAAVIRAREAVRKTTISAPFDGVVGAREVAVGELIDPSRRVTRLESLDRLVVELMLAETALAGLAPGQPARVSADALPGQTFEGAVAYVAPRVADQSRTVAVRVSVVDPERRLRPGMTARATVVTESVPAAILIPTEAVVRAGGKTSAYVVGAESKAELRPLTLGDRGPQRVEVLEGLAAGDALVIEGLARLRPGAVVQVAAPAGAP